MRTSDFLIIGFHNYLSDYVYRMHSDWFVIFLTLHKGAKQVLSKATNILSKMSFK